MNTHLRILRGRYLQDVDGSEELNRPLYSTAARFLIGHISLDDF